MSEDDELQKISEMNGLPIEYQIGDRIYKTHVYIENYIVKIEIYKPKDKLRKPTMKTINRIFKMLGNVRIRPKPGEQSDE